LILKIKSYNDLKVKLTYTIDKNKNKEYISMCEIFEIINKAKNIWQVNLNSNTRTQAEILIETPRCIKINIKIYGIKLRNKKIYFLPDGILIFNSWSVILHSYEKMYINIYSENCEEKYISFSDAKIVRHTENNIPIYEYGMIKMKLSDDEEYIIGFSNSELIREIDNRIKLVQQKYIKYKLPRTDIIRDDKSKSILTYVKEMRKHKATYIPLGTYNGKVIIEDMDEVQNILVGGTVMSGKTTYINAIIVSILLTRKPNETKLLIYDSKGVEYSIYNGLPNLLCPVIKNQELLHIALKKICEEIKSRMGLISSMGIKDIDDFNKKVIEWNDSHPKDEKEKIPDIIIILDYVYSQDQDELIEYITKYSRYINVYMIAVINYPTDEIISMISKSHFLTRMSFRVTSQKESKVILGSKGAEKIDKHGEVLYAPATNKPPQKIEVPYITDNDIKRIIDFISNENN